MRGGPGSGAAFKRCDAATMHEAPMQPPQSAVLVVQSACCPTLQTKAVWAQSACSLQAQSVHCCKPLACRLHPFPPATFPAASALPHACLYFQSVIL